MLTIIFNIWLLGALKMHHLMVLFKKKKSGGRPPLSGLLRPPFTNRQCAPDGYYLFFVIRLPVRCCFVRLSVRLIVTRSDPNILQITLFVRQFVLANKFVNNFETFLISDLLL